MFKQRPGECKQNIKILNKAVFNFNFIILETDSKGATQIPIYQESKEELISY